MRYSPLGQFHQPVTVGELPGPAKAKGTAYRMTMVSKISATRRQRAAIFWLVVNISSLLTLVTKAL